MKKIILLIVFTGMLSKWSYTQSSLSSKYDLMPWPKEIKENSAKFIINSDITISTNTENSKRVRNAAISFLRRLSNRTGVFLKEGFPLKNKKGSIHIAFDSISDLNIKTDESYTLKIEDSIIEISAKTDIGAIRGLQTLLQLTKHNASEYFFPGVTITDTPRFVWRGLMIDASRHFQPVNVIKRNLDAMASVKMNVFHWHLTDDQGFRIESKVYPKLQELASDGLYYTQEQIKDVVDYANHLGIRVIPEIDVPGHASAILTAYPELGSKTGYNYTIERYSGIFDPTLNPTKDITYEFLENLFKEVTRLFPDEYFHIGGDENEGKHWNENQDIQTFKQKHKLKTNHDLQTYFNIKLEKILNALGKKLMGWDEIMTPDMPTTAVIHSWRGKNEGLPDGGSLITAAKKGYQTVLSNGYYIDRMLSVEHHYTVDPIGDIQLTNKERSRILGGEATMWSELVTPQTIDSRIWPRTAAISERFWSAKTVNDIENMKKRLRTVSFNLEELGLTHIKNRAVILRGMTNNQDIASLITLANICEPLKVYQRNKGGIEYKTYSPFNLFADACVVDAKDALEFNHAVSSYVEGSNHEDQIISYLRLWSKNHDRFSQLQKNPKITPLNTLSENISEGSNRLLKAIQSKHISKENIAAIKNLITILNSPVADVEVAIINALNKLVTFCQTHFYKNNN
ncbi:family 20 glycosylhydrolase [Tamlana sp. 2201CG12-4]|uniref:beta-N-acetylhexosaminidase n=1 Tax=Tamlana sp. 2201CG12-4 TaxID=3112582 RepID=UPI002DB95560|nr:family 20 glycosylhydrolase [Tamlana sp. 2201CG12-4]MEC3906681.1 family 20 glycosylhydrolase [Tamlana sp. 2201CG12-4]